MQPYLIGIAGCSGAGKSELARHLSKRLDSQASLVSLDCYYLPMDHLPFEVRCRTNFDHPDSLDWNLIRHDIDRLTRGEAILEPVYLFDQHTRAKEMRRVQPAEYVIIEGLFTLHDEHVRRMLDASIFVDAPDDVCLHRRIARDTVERGRTRESVLEQYARTVRPMAEQFVRPTQDYADLIVSGENPLEMSWAAVEQLLLQAA